MKVQLESFPFPVTVRRSVRARRMAIHVESSGGVELVLPRAATHQDGMQFLQERSPWIMRILARQKISARSIPKPVLEHGAIIHCFGDELRLSIEVDAQRMKSSTKEKEGVLYIRVASREKIESAVGAFIISQAKRYFAGQVKEYTDVVQKPVRAIRVINMKTQWGSCNHATHVLTFNWRLALAPEYVARYVVAHEVAHLVHANHAPRFWKVVAMLYPSYATARSWLRTYGGSLHFAT